MYIRYTQCTFAFVLSYTPLKLCLYCGCIVVSSSLVMCLYKLPKRKSHRVSFITKTVWPDTETYTNYWHRLLIAVCFTWTLCVCI